MHQRLPARSRPVPDTAKPVIVTVASWQDTRLDLTAAHDIHTGLGDAFACHMIQLYEPDLAPASDEGVYQILRTASDLEDQLDAVFGQLQPDVVHTHRIEDFEVVAAAARRAGVPHIVHSLDAASCASAGGDECRQQLRLREAGALIVVPTADVPIDTWTGARLCAIAPGIDSRRFRPGDAGRARRKVGLPAGPRILGCGSPSQDLDTLLQAMFHLQQDFHLALFGPAVPTPDQRHRIRRLGLGERIHVLGPWAEPDLIYRAIDAYFHGPGGSPFPRPVLAAQAAGKPVIATWPTREELLCPSAAHLLPTLFVPAMTSAIQRAMKHRGRDTVRQFVERRWRADLMVDAHRDLFLAVIAASAGNPAQPAAGAAVRFVRT